MPDPTDARAAGQQAVSSLRRSLEERVADLIRRDPERAANAVEVGLVDRAWLDDPAANRFRTATPFEVVQRFVERSVEQRPSVLGSLGVNALQLLSMRGFDGDEDAHQRLAVVFTDLEGFTRYNAEVGDEVAVQLLADHHRAVGPVVRSRGGRVVKRLGDGLMVVFPEPEAAVLAALELLTTAPDPLRLRAGLHLGDAVLTHDDVLGTVVNLAARVAETARGDEVLATTDVRESVSGLSGVRFGRARRVRMKGFDDPVRVCRVERA